MNQSYEDAYIYLDLTKETLKKKDIIKAIKSYVEEKKNVNDKGHFAILIFHEDGNPIFITEKEDADIIVNSIEENWNIRSKEKSYFENGLFYIFSYIAETIQKKSKVNRVIIITDTPSDLAPEYQEALFNLVSKIKHFPTFIDIIRIAETSERFFKDDVKLNMLASDTKGGIFYIQERKEFFDVITKLVKNKQSVSTFEDKPDKIEISVEDYAFYNKLAKELKKSTTEDLLCRFCSESLCPKCSDIEDVPLICEACGSAFHGCCVSQYVVNNNIGIPNIFRCPNCGMLLKINEEIITEKLVQNSNGIFIENHAEQEELEKFPRVKGGSIERIQLQKSSKLSINQENQISLDQGTSENEIRKVRIGGFFGKEFVVKKVGDKIVYDLPKDAYAVQKTSKIEMEKSTYWSASSHNSDEKEKKSKIMICSICGVQIKSSELRKCPNCGNILR